MAVVLFNTCHSSTLDTNFVTCSCLCLHVTSSTRCAGFSFPFCFFSLLLLVYIFPFLFLIFSSSLRFPILSVYLAFSFTLCLILLFLFSIYNSPVIDVLLITFNFPQLLVIIILGFLSPYLLLTLSYSTFIFDVFYHLPIVSSNPRYEFLSYVFVLILLVLSPKNSFFFYLHSSVLSHSPLFPHILRGPVISGSCTLIKIFGRTLASTYVVFPPFSPSF